MTIPLQPQDESLREQIRKLVNDTRKNYAYPEAMPSDEYEDELKSAIFQLVAAQRERLLRATLKAFQDKAFLLISELSGSDPHPQLEHEMLTDFTDMLSTRMKEYDDDSKAGVYDDEDLDVAIDRVLTKQEAKIMIDKIKSYRENDKELGDICGNIASLELCKELYELSGWNPPQGLRWGTYSDSSERYLSTLITGGDCPAYDLGYLLRKLPTTLDDDTTWEMHRLVEGYGIAYPDWFLAAAGTPEDAACKLSIELFKQGILSCVLASSNTSGSPRASVLLSAVRSGE